MPEGGRIIDLTMPVEEGMQTYTAPWHPRVEVTGMGRHSEEGRRTSRLVLGTHSGTHVDAPSHFLPGGETIENIPLERMVGPASVLDFSLVPDKRELSPGDVEKALDGRPPERIIFRFDWDIKALGEPRYFSDHPFLSEEACSWLLGIGCSLVALDTPQPDNPLNSRGSEKDAPCHKILLGGGVVIVEYLVNIRDIRSPLVDLVVAPLRIRGGDGAPCRCFAVDRGGDA